MSELIVMGLATLGLLPKAALDLTYFKDPDSARKTICLWAALIAVLSASLGFSLLIYYFG